MTTETRAPMPDTRPQETSAVDAGKPADTGKPRKDKPQGNVFLAFLGKPTFRPGDGKRYPRTAGYNSKDKHPDGGTNETVAFVVFKPFQGLSGASVESRIYAERTTKENGVDYPIDAATGKPKEKTVYSVAFPSGIKIERTAKEAQAARLDFEDVIWNGYASWAKTDEAKQAAASAAKVNRRARTLDE